MAILEGELEETQPTQDEEIDGIEKRKPARKLTDFSDRAMRDKKRK